MKRILKVKKSVNIEDGEKIGKITGFSWRSRPYDYLDIHIQFKNNDEVSIIKAGFPAMINYNSKLGQLLSRFGKKFYENDDIDVEEILNNQIIKFNTFTQTNEKGSFAKINVDSIRPKGVTP